MTMNITNYFNRENDRISFTRQQASLFAKSVAGDFNPIHDENAKRFCVPGDLLFAVFLSQYGISQEMKFDFAGMVGENTQLHAAKETSSEMSEGSVQQEAISPQTAYSLQDDSEKNYMDISVSGEQSNDTQFISALSEKYVQFSGRTFPHILVPLMKQEGVMINPSRPLVIYKNMEIYLDRLSGDNIDLELKSSLIQQSGKKGEVRLEFKILANGEEIGHGAKNLLLSGLRDYDQEQLDQVIHSYDQWKLNYLSK